MNDPRAARLVERALRCYPARWRRRHGDEAAELAALLIRDGASAGSIALSYLAGAGREWLTPRPGGRLAAAACALLVAVCSLGISAVLLAPPAPARAAITSTRIPGGAAAGPSHGRDHPRCRPGSSDPVPGLIRAMGQLSTIVWEIEHVRVC
jgi:hypothetical protein